MIAKRWVARILVLLSCWACSGFAQDPQLSPDETKDFLRNARVVNERQIGKGVTAPFRLTLSDGKLTHDAQFQAVDEFKAKMEFGDGRFEMNFRDSYRYNIAAYELATLLGLGDMMPVTVERKWGGKTGALAWWLPVKMDEEKRSKSRILPPDPEAWMKEIHRMRVFSQLVYDTDRNLGNTLYGEDWHVWMIDFTRAFRLYKDLQDSKILERCDRRLLESLRQLKSDELTKVAGKWLRKPEIEGVMARRDKIVACFEKLISEKGENQVLY